MTTKKDEIFVPDIVEIDFFAKDGDVCNKNELNQLYLHTYNCTARKAVGLDELFVLHIDAAWETNKLVTALSNHSVLFSSADTLEKISTFNAHDQSIVDIHFNPVDNNCLFTASNDGTIRQWDLRTNLKTHSQEFKDEGESRKPLMSFDINCKGQFLCAGTEQIKKDAYLLVWDVRNTKLMSGYWESHTDDVSHIQFHPTESSTMASCSTDGLINIFDVSMTEEDDALQYSLNTETSCGRLQWLRKVSINAISVITHTEAIQFWDVEEATMKHSFDRKKLRKALKRNTTETCYAVRCFQTDDEVLVLGGSSTPNRGCLRLMKVNEGSLEPYAVLYDKEGANNSQVVRCAVYNPVDETVISGGEDGIVNVWRRGEQQKQVSAINPMVDVPSRKSASNRKSSNKPYRK